MSIEISSFSDVSEAKVAAMVATMAQLMGEQHPEVELTRGVFHDLVLYFNSLLNAAIQENIDRVLRSKSLLQLLQDPTLADDELVDQVLSNFNLKRDSGSPATGLATFILATPNKTIFLTDSDYTVDTFAFRLTDTFTVVTTPEEIAGATYRVMRPVGDGTYAVTLPMRAVDIGVAGNIKRGTPISANFTPDNVIQLYAASDFVGGREPINNADYVKKLAAGLSAKAIGSRTSYEAFIRAKSGFENILHVSVLGAGDPEQQRDQHGLFPISGGGKIDIYVQTTPSAQDMDHQVTATFLGDTPNGTLWQTVVPKNIAPGFYEIARVLSPDAASRAARGFTVGTYRIVEDIRNVDLTGTLYVPDIQYIPEGAYSPYQNAVIRFEDTDKMSPGLTPQMSTAQYVLTTRGLPLIGDINAYLTDKDNRARATDILIKAAVPCFTRISFEIHTDMTDTISADTILAMKKAIVEKIAAVGFSGQLHASLITGVAQQFLKNRQAVNEIDMFGRIRRPDGTTIYLRDNTLLAIPNDPARLVTGRTTVFLTDIADVSITPVVAGYTT